MKKLGHMLKLLVPKFCPNLSVCLRKDIAEKQVPVNPKPIVGILSKRFRFMHEVLLADSSGVATSLRSLGTSFSEEAPLLIGAPPHHWIVHAYILRTVCT